MERRDVCTITRRHWCSAGAGRLHPDTGSAGNTDRRGCRADGPHVVGQRPSHSVRAQYGPTYARS